MREDGKSLTEVRDAIDEKYSRMVQGVEPSPSPYPPSGM